MTSQQLTLKGHLCQIIAEEELSEKEHLERELELILMDIDR